MHCSLLRVACLSLLCAASAQAIVTYQPLDDTNVIVTGVRAASDTTDSVVLTANYTTGGVEYAGLYEGSLAAAPTAPSSAWNTLTPVFQGQTVTGATFYGPNTPLFDPSIGAGNVVAVGSYKYTEGSPGPAANHGLLYVGPINGVGGAWTQIDAIPLLAQGETLLNTIAHSNMGELVVGNYDTNITTGKAFIYNRVTQTWRNLNPGGTISVTAYGIWQNGGSTSTNFTIAGGQGNLGPGVLDKSYLVDYDSATDTLSNYRTYDYNNTPSSAALSHFDGITENADGGYNLTGFVTTNGAVKGFFATVRRKVDNTFGNAVWTDVFYPGSTITTGNTVVDNKVLGIFINGGTQSYLATVAPAQYGVAIAVAKSGDRATFTITNTGDTTAGFSILGSTGVTSSGSAPNPAPGPGKPRYTVKYTLDGAPATSAIKAGSATVTLAPGAAATVVEQVKAKTRLAYKRTVRTTLDVASQTSPSVTASATVKLTLKKTK
jgi:hypothetical protein